MYETVFAISQRENYYFKCSSRALFSEQLPEGFQYLVDTGDLEHILFATFGACDSYVVTYKDRKDCIQISSSGLPTALEEWIHARDDNNVPERSLANIKVALGPNNNSYLAFDDIDTICSGLPETLCQQLAQLEEAKDGLRLVSLGTEENYIIITNANQSFTKLKSYRSVRKFLIELSSLEGGYANVSNVFLHPYRLDSGIILASNGKLSYTNPSPQTESHLFCMVEAIQPASRETEVTGAKPQLEKLYRGVEKEKQEIAEAEKRRQSSSAQQSSPQSQNYPTSSNWLPQQAAMSPVPSYQSSQPQVQQYVSQTPVQQSRPNTLGQRQHSSPPQSQTYPPQSRTQSYVPPSRSQTSASPSNQTRHVPDWQPRRQSEGQRQQSFTPAPISPHRQTNPQQQANQPPQTQVPQYVSPTMQQQQHQAPPQYARSFSSPAAPTYQQPMQQIMGQSKACCTQACCARAPEPTWNPITGWSNRPVLGPGRVSFSNQGQNAFFNPQTVHAVSHLGHGLIQLNNQLNNQGGGFGGMDPTGGFGGMDPTGGMGALGAMGAFGGGDPTGGFGAFLGGWGA